MFPFYCKKRFIINNKYCFLKFAICGSKFKINCKNLFSFFVEFTKMFIKYNQKLSLKTILFCFRG